MDSIKPEEIKQEILDQDLQDHQEIDSDYYTEILNRKKIKSQEREQSILNEKNQKKSYNW